MQIKKAIIPVAGLGTRFLPATKAQPKEMLPIIDKPAIQYVVEEAIAAGIKQILFVTGRGKQAIENHFDRSIELEHFLYSTKAEKNLKEIKNIAEMCSIYYVRQKSPNGLGHAILCGESFIEKNEPFAVFLADDIINAKIPGIKQLMKVYDKYKAPVLALMKVEDKDVSRYGIIKGEQIKKKLFQISDMVEKPVLAKAPSNMAIIGRYILDSSIFNLLKNTKRGKNKEIQLTDALKEYNKDKSMYGLEFDGKRLDVGDKLGYLKTIVEFAVKNKDLKKDFIKYLKNLIKKY